jgi:transposase-like protein
MCLGRGMGPRTSGWVPPHCPNPNCSYFNPLRTGWRFLRKGFYTRQRAPHRIQRFTCVHCRRHFSTQTFSTTYWQKRPDLIARIFSMVVGCMANRQIARALGCSPTTVAHHIARLGRHCLLFEARELGKLPPLGEIVIDGFESFEWSQYFPFHHNVAVDVESGYFLFHTDSPLRRKGRMTAFQKARREELERSLGRPNPRAVENGMRDLLSTLSRGRSALAVRSDDHRAYPRALRSLACDFTHRVTSSRQRRDDHNPLWEVNVLDLMIRHSTAAHKRETIAWAKRRQASIEKLTIFQVWRNYIKKRREKGGEVTSAMLLGLARRRLQIREVLQWRLFFGRIEMGATWQRYYRREVVTRALGVNRKHALKYAF